jgi:hypothetical protein
VQFHHVESLQVVTVGEGKERGNDGEILGDVVGNRKRRE